MKMENRSHRLDINRSRARHGYEYILNEFHYDDGYTISNT